MIANATPTTTLETRLRILLPETYAVFDKAVKPVSMGSASLKFDADGRVPWNEMWGSFCDLAMAGGPPHRGTLLLPPADPQPTAQYDNAAAEICRGLGLVTGLCAEPSPKPGWVRLYCTSAAMTGWLMRAIVMENVSARARGLALELPAGENFRIEKEIKNVITAVAKTCHYWQDHTSEAQQEQIADLLATMERETPLVQPGGVDASDVDHLAHQLYTATGLQRAEQRYSGWLGVDCRDIAAAIWNMRALAVSNILARREGTVLFLPVDAMSDPGGNRVLQAMVEVGPLAAAYAVLPRG